MKPLPIGVGWIWRIATEGFLTAMAIEEEKCEHVLPKRLAYIELVGCHNALTI
jgi:hypothetical protein